MHFYCNQCREMIRAGAGLCPHCGNVFHSPAPFDSGEPGVCYWPPDNPQGLQKFAVTATNAWDSTSNKTKFGVASVLVVLLIIGAVRSMIHTRQELSVGLPGSVAQQPVGRQVAMTNSGANYPAPPSQPLSRVPAVSAPDPPSAPPIWKDTKEEDIPSTPIQYSGSSNRNSGNPAPYLQSPNTGPSEAQQQAGAIFSNADIDAMSAENVALQEDMRPSAMQRDFVFQGAKARMIQDLYTMQQAYPQMNTEGQNLNRNSISEIRQQINEFDQKHHAGGGSQGGLLPPPGSPGDMNGMNGAF